MRSLPFLPAAILAALALFGGAAAAGSYDASDPYYRQRAPNEKGVFDYDDSGDKPWTEDQAKIPPPPAPDADWPEVSLDSLPKGFRAYLDPGSVELNPNDNVLRYWLIVRSGSSSAVSYEGVNCSAREFKTYAYADPRSPGGVRPVREPRWQAVGGGRRGDYHGELFESVLCVGTGPRDSRGIAAAVQGYYHRVRPMSEYTENLRPPMP